MKKNWPYYLVLLLVVVFLYRVSTKASKRRIDWEDDFSGQSRSPFGCLVAKDFVKSTMTSEPEDVNQTAYEKLAGQNFTGRNYIFVNDEFSPSAQDVMQLCRFAAAGNTVLISARSFGLLSDTLKVDLIDPLTFDMRNDSVKTFGAAMTRGSKEALANFVNPKLHLPKDVLFDRTTFTQVFLKLDTSKTTVLGTDGDHHVNYVRVNFGKGQFLLHTFPDAFGNYYAADRSTSKYLFRLLSYLPDHPTFIDEHYKIGRIRREGINGNDDPRRYMLSVPALRLAYLILVIAGGIALIFGGKRRQRPVPVVEPQTNSTLEFVEQVGVLYYRQANHSDIVHKKINYFLESVRSRFYTQTNEMDDKFMERMENLSGVPSEQVRHLFMTIQYLRSSVGASEKDLKNLDHLIWEFNRRSKR